MSISAPRSEQAASRFAEAQSLADAGFRERAVEALHAAAELLVDELAERESVEIAHESLGWHEARARASVRLRQLGVVPAGFDNLLRRLNDDRKRTKYDDKPTRFDPMTFAQAQASVRIVIESLGVKLAPEPPDAPPAPPLGPPEAPAPPEAGAPPPPEPEAAAAAAPPPPAHRLRRPGVALTAAAIVAAAAIVVVALIAFQAGEQQKSPRKPRRAGAAPIGYGRKATLAGVSYQVDTARIGDRAAFQPPITSRRGTFVLVYLRVVNPTDRTLPLRFDALRLQTREGVVYEPTANLARFTLALTKNARQELPVPYDVPRSSVRGARLLVQRTSASGARRRSGLILDLALGDGLGELMPGTWRGRTSQGLPFSMRIEKGDVVRSVTVRGRSGRECTVRARGAAFVEGGLFRMHTGALSVDGRFSSSIDASGAVTSAGSQRCAFGTLRWRARTDLR